MFVYNFKLSKTNIFKIIFCIVVIILILFFLISAFKIFNSSKPMEENTNVDVANITSKNYTNILKAVHDDLDTYLGQTIKFVGYVYRVEDFSKDEFVLARDMVINNKNQTLVVGFLSNCKDADKFQDKTWVEVIGTIKKGDYHGEIPIIQVTKMTEVEKPSDEFVTPPDDFYIPTSSLYFKRD